MDHRTYLKIDLNKLEHNYNSVRNKLPSGVKLLGVIKANAYGNGAVEIGKFLMISVTFSELHALKKLLNLKKRESKHRY